MAPTLHLNARCSSGHTKSYKEPLSSSRTHTCVKDQSRRHKNYYYSQCLIRTKYMLYSIRAIKMERKEIPCATQWGCSEWSGIWAWPWRVIAVCSHSPPALSTILVSTYLTLCQLSLPSVSKFLKGMGFALCVSECVVCFNNPYPKFAL